MRGVVLAGESGSFWHGLIEGQRHDVVAYDAGMGLGGKPSILSARGVKAGCANYAASVKRGEPWEKKTACS